MTFGQLIVGKSLKLLRPDVFTRCKICQNAFVAMALPRAPLGELTVLPQIPLLDLRGLLLREGEEREGGREGEERKGEGKRREGKGREGGGRCDHSII